LNCRGSVMFSDVSNITGGCGDGGREGCIFYGFHVIVCIWGSRVQASPVRDEGSLVEIHFVTNMRISN